MYPSIIEVDACEGYRLRIRFDNGEQGILDMEDLLEFGVFKTLKNPEAFKRVRVAFDTIEWESGADLDPEFVYKKARKTENAQSPI